MKFRFISNLGLVNIYRGEKPYRILPLCKIYRDNKLCRYKFLKKFSIYTSYSICALRSICNVNIKRNEISIYIECWRSQHISRRKPYRILPLGKIYRDNKFCRYKFLKKFSIYTLYSICALHSICKDLQDINADN